MNKFCEMKLYPADFINFILLTFVFLIVLRAEFGCVSGDRYYPYDAWLKCL